MIRTFANTIATALRSGTHTFQGDSFVYKCAEYVKLSVLGLTVILGFPVAYGRTQQLLYGY